MADNKLSWTELRKALAMRAGTSEKEAKLFLDALNQQIMEGLKQDKQVKINGIGTFRMQSVAPRESVNVNTGERITIPGYEKVVFNPEAGMKELIEHNTPMKKKNAKKTAAEVNPLEKLGEQADEIVGILTDLGQSPDEKAPKSKKADDKQKETAAKAEQLQEEAKIAEPAPKPVTLPEKPVEAAKTEAAPIPVTKEEPKAEKKPKKQSHFLRDTLICVIILLLLLLIGYFFLRNQISGWLDSLNDPKPVQTEQVVVEAAPAPVEEKVMEPDVPEEIVYDKLITTERMHRHSRLAWMAWRYYGNKAFWVYLYDANKDHIVNPDKITTGTPIRVPKLTEEQMDTTNKRTQLILERLTKQGEEAKKR